MDFVQFKQAKSSACASCKLAQADYLGIISIVYLNQDSWVFFGNFGNCANMEHRKTLIIMKLGLHSKTF